MRRSNGMTLGTVLLILVTMATSIFALAAVGVSHYQLAVAHFNRNAAAEAARSVVAVGLVHLRRDGHWGADAKASLTIPYQNSSGTLTFVPGAQPYSSNNLEAAQSQGWAGEPIPREFVRLVGVGSCRGQEQVVEAWYHAPTYPWAIAAGGSVRLSGGARIAGLKQAPAPDAPLGDLLPADLRCNGDSVTLGKGTEIFGDVLTSGHVEVEPGADLTVGPVAPLAPRQESVWVHGGVKGGEGEPAITGVDLTRFDPRAQDLIHSSLTQESYTQSVSVSDSRRRQGNVVFNSGLSMEGGLLFVEGDLTVRGGLTGAGMVVCTGKVSVEGTASLRSGSGVALVAGGQVALSGADSSGSYFQGLVYTDTGFSADRVSLVGPLVSAGKGTVELTRAQLLMPPNLPEKWAAAGTAGGGGPDPATTVTVFQGQFDGPGTSSDWHHAWVYQKHQDAEGVIYYEGTRYNKNPDGTVNPVPSQRLSANDLSTSGWRLHPTDAQELQDKPITPDEGDPPPPAADPQASSGPIISLDPSQFYRLQDRLRKVLWVEH